MRDAQGHETSGGPEETLTLAAGQPGRHAVPIPLDARFPPGRYVLRFEARAEKTAEPVVRERGFEVTAPAH